MVFHLNDFVPSDLTDAQKKTTICDWFVNIFLDFPNCFIRTELNQAPRNIKVTIEKPIDFKGELVDFADIVIEYETPVEEMAETDKNINAFLVWQKYVCQNNLWKESVLSNAPKTNEAYGKKRIKSLFSIDYTAPHLFRDELKLIENTHELLMGEQLNKLTPISAFEYNNPPDYENVKKECLLLSIIPTVEALKTDINKAIRRIKTLEFYMKNVTQKHIVYWGMTDDAIKKYLQHENIGLTGLYDNLYSPDEKLEKNIDEFNSLMEPK